jgi:hypothetical protein|tara:strand:- start:505 stop:2016 length:1512 start_codon:yes stop_codon:yes gene_type:complete
MSKQLAIRPYEPEPTAARFHRDNSDVRGVMGPVGTGKTVICCMEAWSRMLEQRVGLDGETRKSRWAFIRNTYPELISTTMKTWQDWIPDEICHINMSAPITGKMDFWLADNTRVVAEVIFIAIDRAEDVRKLKSLELTGAFLNEASELEEQVVEMALQRTGRYPAKIDGGSEWSGVIMDTNPPSDDHWWHERAEIKQPINHSFYRQPPAILPVYVKGKSTPASYVPNEGQNKNIPPAENVKWQDLGYEYWMRQSHGADPEWIKVYLMGEYGSVISGKPVYPEYSDAAHFDKNLIEPYRGLPIIIGWDFGLTPACVFVQVNPKGNVVVIDECVSEDMELRRFVEEIVRPKLQTRYPGIQLYSVGDPAGNQRSQADGITCLNILDECGIPTVTTNTNSPVARRDAVKYYLTRMVEGAPAFAIGPYAPFLRKGFLGGYKFKEVRTGGIAGKKRYHEIPDKNFYSHVSDALQYAMLHIREGLQQARNNHSFIHKTKEISQPDMGAWN